MARDHSSTLRDDLAEKSIAAPTPLWPVGTEKLMPRVGNTTLSVSNTAILFREEKAVAMRRYPAGIYIF